MNKETLKKLIKGILLEILKDLRDKKNAAQGGVEAPPAVPPMESKKMRKEVSTSAAAGPFNTPKAFKGKGKKRK